MTTLTRLVPLGEQVQAVRAGAVTVAAGAAGSCDRIDEIDASVHAFVPEPARRERLTAEADALVTRSSAQQDVLPLYGVPVGVKDIVHVDGLPTCAGSAVPAQVLAGAQATVVTRLREAGALVAGKTATAEFATLTPGPTSNPHHLGHTPGGSSSGSAAAVAAGMVPLALGTQTIGSVIRPAAFCGVVGFKPTYGRIPKDGVIPNAPSLDHVGTFTADAAGASIAAAALCDGWRPDVRSTKHPVLGVPLGPYLAHVEAQATEAFAEQLALLRERGYSLRRVPVLENFDEVTRLLFVINRYELAQTHAEWFDRFGELYRRQTVDQISEGQQIDLDDYRRALQQRAELVDTVGTVMTAAGIDLWVTPAATGPAPEGLGSTGNPVMSMPWSLTGLPSVTLPAGSAPSGLPLGLQCVAGAHSDEQLLAWAPDIEAALRTVSSADQLAQS